MGSYPPPPAKLPPQYLPLSRGILGPSNPRPYPNFRNFDRGLGQFHSGWITDANYKTQLPKPLTNPPPHPSAGPMFWPNAQWKNQKFVPTYGGPDQDLGDCGCGGSKAYGCGCSDYGAVEAWDNLPFAGKAVLGLAAAVAVVALFSKS